MKPFCRHTRRQELNGEVRRLRATTMLKAMHAAEPNFAACKVREAALKQTECCRYRCSDVARVTCAP